MLSTLALATLINAQEVNLSDRSRLDVMHAKVDNTTHRGKPAFKMVEGGGGDPLAVIKGSNFRDGLIEVEVAGEPAKGADAGARGFIGVAFRLQDAAKFELFYTRPTNGRADDQLRRNHATQYVSAPDWPWQRLRKEFPGVYESYADMQSGEWTKLRIRVKGKEAFLYVGAADQPCLIVKELKHGESSGAVALWIGSETEGYFRNLKISPN